LYLFPRETVTQAPPTPLDHSFGVQPFSKFRTKVRMSNLPVLGYFFSLYFRGGRYVGEAGIFYEHAWMHYKMKKQFWLFWTAYHFS